MRLNKPITAITAVGLLALSACGGSGGSSSSANPATQTTESQLINQGAAGEGKDPTRKAPAAPIPGAKKGGTLTVEVNGGLTTMDPTEAYYLDTSSILSSLVVRSLTQYAYDPKTKDMILVPDLATDLGTPSNNFKTWKFTLRSGIKFENGQPVTAQDMKYGIERSFDRSTFPGGAQYSNQYFLHGDTYKGPYKSGNYDGVTIKGNTLTIKMARPFPDMPYWGAFPAISPIPPGKASDPATYKNHPLATGPYKFAQYTPGQTLTLVKNTQWDPNTDPGRHQYVNGFKMNFTTDSTKIDQTILGNSGAGQTTLSYDPVLAADYHKFTTDAPDQLIKGGQPCTFMWYPDNRQITDVNVRRALAWAYPYQAAWAAGGYIAGVTRSPASNYMPPGVPGRVEYNPLPGHTPGSTDPAKAKQLLQKAGKTNYPIKFAYETDVPQSVAVKNVVVQALTQAGFKPEPVASTSANYATDILGDPKAPVNVRAVGWCSDWPSGATWIPPTFQTTNIKSEGLGANYEAFSSKLVDNKIKSIQLLPVSKQPAAWNALDKLIMTKYFPVVLTGYGGSAMMRGTKVEGMNDDKTNGMPTWKDMWIG
jgi:peptide/nickel transport system substrate-binding protein